MAPASKETEIAMINDAPQARAIQPMAGLELDIDHRFAGLRRLLEITDRINPGVLLDEAFRQIDEMCRPILPFDSIEFALLDDRGDKLTRRWIHRQNEADNERNVDVIPIEEGLRGSVLEKVLVNAKPAVFSDLARSLAEPESSAFLMAAAGQGMRCALIAPLISASKSVGILIFSSANAECYLPSHQEWLGSIVAPLSALIAKGRLYEMVIQAQLDSERLLRNVLPEPIVKRLKAGEQVIADGIPEATVVFVDIVNFVRLSATMPPSSVIIVLNRIFSAFDALCEQYEVEKIKTIGDAYMLATGVIKPLPEHVVIAARIALDMLELGKRLGTREERSLNFRIGIHTGPVVAGVIGTRKFSYDLWGDTVNIASRMETHGLPGRIHVSREVYEKLKDDFDLEARGLIDVKGIGEMETYFLNSPKAGNTYRSVVWSMLNRSSLLKERDRRVAED
jgi:class 3 adenylate cyclase